MPTMEAKRRALESIVAKPDVKATGNAVSVLDEPGVQAAGAPSVLVNRMVREAATKRLQSKEGEGKKPN